MDFKNINLEDLIKRDLYDKFADSVKDIKKNFESNISDCEKKKIIKQIAYLILLFQMDNFYKGITNTSGIESILQLFGLSEKNANNSLLIVNTKEDSGKKKIANNNINKEMFDSNPELTNNIFPIGSQVNSTNTFNLVQQKKAKSNNMNSSFVEDLTDDWKD